MVDQKQRENVKYLKCLGSMVTNYVSCTREIQSTFAALAKAAFNKKKNLFASKLDWNLEKKLVNSFIWSIAMCGTENWTLQKVDLKDMES